MDLGFITPLADRVCVPVPPKRGGTWNRTLRSYFRTCETGLKQETQDADPPEVTCSGIVEQEKQFPEILIVLKRTSCFNRNETEQIGRDGSVALPPLSPASAPTSIFQMTRPLDVAARGLMGELEAQSYPSNSVISLSLEFSRLIQAIFSYSEL